MRMKRRPWGETIINENHDKVLMLNDLDDDLFLDYISFPHLVLEIGSGKGDFIITMAKNNPTIRFIAVEVQSMALAYAIRKLNDEKLDNLIFVNADITLMFVKLKERKFDTIFLNFSDPWPKKRHHKRRLTYPSRLEEYAKILSSDGKLIFKSDNDILFNDSLEYIKESSFELEKVDYDYDGNDPFDAQTEYETKFRGLGTPIKRYIARLKKE
ncbi:MAG: tRNA (guanosine(46)-N7)-methyltransferase TrmB [Bacillales bacterium]|nr:tRNA (guanosine(46)-N7)-methyltransferase TrmB [Bacillales bacterium]